MQFYSFEPFGYEGSLVTVECDCRKGIPFTDIVGVTDSTNKLYRDVIKSAINNSGLEYPTERVLISLSPADLRKEQLNHSFAVALSVIDQKDKLFPDEKVLVLGELDEGGNIKPVLGAHAAVAYAVSLGINNIICSPYLEQEVKDSIGDNIKINILSSNNLSDCVSKLKSLDNFITYDSSNVKTESEEITFNENIEMDFIDEKFLAKYKDNVRAMEIAVAGKHNLLFVGAAGCGKTLLAQRLLPVITPNLTLKEAQVKDRIDSLAGLRKPHASIDTRVSFRMPHQTVTVEGMCGGGPHCRPGEISLAHNGILFLDEASLFRTSCLEMLRIPLRDHSICLSRAGRTTIYPANFQLVMAAEPSPDGKWNKLENTKLESIITASKPIQSFVYPNENAKGTVSVDSIKKRISDAFKIQRKSGNYNEYLSPLELKERLNDSFTSEMSNWFDKTQMKYGFSDGTKFTTLKVALTIANLDNREKIQMKDLKEAVDMVKDWKIDVDKKIYHAKELTSERER